MIELHNDSASLRLAPRLGGGVAAFRAIHEGEWVELLRPAPIDVDGFNDLAAYWLVPWCNRIPRGRFTFDGRAYEIETNWPDEGVGLSAIHGVACRQQWAVDSTTNSLARLSLRWPGKEAVWPWAFEAKLEYRLEGTAFAATVGVTNTSDTPMPLGLGFHPYFLRHPAKGNGDVRIRASVDARFVAENLIATGELEQHDVVDLLNSGEPLGTHGTDHAYEGFGGAAEVSWPGTTYALEIRCSPIFRRLHVFTRAPLNARATEYAEPMPFVAAEPVSQASDAFNRAASGSARDGECLVLDPGESADGTLHFALKSLATSEDQVIGSRSALRSG